MNTLALHYRWKESGLGGVFRYIIQPLREITFRNDPFRDEPFVLHPDLLFVPGERYVAAVMVYNQMHYALVTAALLEVFEEPVPDNFNDIPA